MTLKNGYFIKLKYVLSVLIIVLINYSPKIKHYDYVINSIKRKCDMWVFCSAQYK